MDVRTISPGQPVVYRKLKYSSRPGPRAVRIVPSARGEQYAYEVDKYWIVAETREDDSVIVITRRGKRHRVRCDDPNLRRPTLWERLRYASRFPRREAAASYATSGTTKGSR
jgi:hypothetical protein